MLSPETIKKIKQVHIKSGRLVNTIMAGQYRSVFRGSGIEFEEVREYSPGDEVKNIDWKVSARLGRPFIKLYREEREQIVILLLDVSASTNFGTSKQLKRETAAEFAAILAFNAIRNNDKVGALLFSDRVEKYIPPKKGSGHVWRVIKEIFDFQPQCSGTDINFALGYLGSVCRKRAVAFLISDFLDQDYQRPLKTLSRKHEIIGVLLSDPGDFVLPERGLVSAMDFETGRRVLLDAGNKAVCQRYTQVRRQVYQNARKTLHSSDIDCIEIATTASVADALVRFFRYREKRRRR
jgi:uncharacterized protein (DUF58 family)